MDLYPPNITYPDLPVSREREQILRAIAQHQVIVVVGDTGSGKTTQLPKMAWELERTRSAKQPKSDRPRQIGCTQPRRIAASGVANRVADELKSPLGEWVGYQVRFEDHSSEQTAIKFMTDGILLAEIQGDPDLRRYSTLIIDEAHERSLNIDFLLGYLKRLISRRPDLKLIISSATLDAGGFAEFFNQAPIIQVEGRTYPVEVFHLPPFEDEDLPEHLIRSVRHLDQFDNLGDILVFLPGEREINEVANRLAKQVPQNTDVLKLFARLSLGDQQRVFNPTPGRRRIVLATNVAETSVTIPDIIYVIDSGVARVSRWAPKRGVQRLQIEPISQASANQRKGRCGRVAEGICLRLYSDEDFELRPEFTDPEIRRSSLAGVILKMKTLGLPAIEDFPFIDPPSKKNIIEGYRTLREIGALTRKRELTPIGHQLARLPVDPRHARMLLAAADQACLPELLVIVAGLSVMDPRERPLDKANQADEAHRQWRDPDSDFITYLNLWHHLQPLRKPAKPTQTPPPDSSKSTRQQNYRHLPWQLNQLRKYCKKNFLNFRRVLEWDNLHRTLVDTIRRSFKWSVPALPPVIELDRQAADRIHRAMLAGIPRSFGQWDGQTKAYRGTEGKVFSIFPGSTLFSRKKRQPWVLATELVETSRLWARKLAKLEPEWVEQVAPHLCHYHYHSAAFDPTQGAVYAKEKVTCGGLTLLDNRRVHYGRIAPDKAREIFIREAILGNGLKSRPAFLRHLDALREQTLDMEQKLRRRNALWCEEAVIDFFDQILPPDIHTAKAFHQWRKKLEAKDRRALHIGLDDALYEPLDELPLSSFPNTLNADQEEYPIYYQHLPGAPDDGVTIGIHIDQLLTFPEWLPAWGVPGQLADRAEVLIRTLPKEQRKHCQPIRDTAEAFAEDFEYRMPTASELPHANFYRALSEFLNARFVLLLTPEAFDASRLPPELVTKLWICDDQGEELAMGTELAHLKTSLANLIAERFAQAASAEWESSGHQHWDFGDLPESIVINDQVGYPALIDEGTTVGLKVFATQAEAHQHHRGGCIRLAYLTQHEFIDYLRKTYPLSQELRLYLPMLGRHGDSNFAQLIELTVEAALGDSLPRTADEFSQSVETLRVNLFICAEELAKCLEQVVQHFRQVSQFCEKDRNHRYHGPVVVDVEAQIDWLFRPQFFRRAGIEQIRHYPRYFAAINERIERLHALPYLRDLDKFNQLAPYLDDWAEAANSPALPEAVTDQLAWALQEWRVALFAPSQKAAIKISEKRIASLCDQLLNPP